MRSPGFDFAAAPYFTIDGVLSSDESGSLIERIEALGPRPATSNGADGPTHDLTFRNNGRVRFEDATLAALLYGRVSSQLPPLLNMVSRCALPHFRGYRYRPGEYFAPHVDVAYFGEHERSLLTLLVYLNDDFSGGRTRFVDIDEACTPRAGRAVLFQHLLRHEGECVRLGTKYAVRTNVVYEAPPSTNVLRSNM